MMVHNETIVIRFLMTIGAIISNTNEYDKEREYVRKNVQTQREQHYC